jgi:peptidyl-prolyl cis-trans isomerase C
MTGKRMLFSCFNTNGNRIAVAVSFRHLSLALSALFLSHLVLADQGRVEQGLTIAFEARELARQGGAILTDAEFDVFMERVAEEHHLGFLISRERLSDAMNNLMLPRLIAAHAASNGYLEAPEVQARLYQNVVMSISDSYLADHLAELELDDYEQVARELYLRDPDRFKTPDRFDFTHVLVATGRERGELEAMERVLYLYEQMTEGRELTDLASEYSDEEGARDNAGQFTEISFRDLDEIFAAALFQLPDGTISEPVRTQFGWHIIRRDGHHEPRRQTFEEARERAINVARRRHQERISESLVSGLRSQQMEINVAGLKDYLERYDILWEGVEVD